MDPPARFGQIAESPLGRTWSKTSNGDEQQCKSEEVPGSSTISYGKTSITTIYCIYVSFMFTGTLRELLKRYIQRLSIMI